MGSVAYLLQVSFFYTFAGFLIHPQWTIQGDALYYVLNVHEFSKPLGLVMLQHPLFMQQTTVAVLWLERYGALFFFIPFKNVYFRLMAIAGIMIFHIGIILCMELKLFQWICLIMLIGFLPTPFLNRILGNFTPGPGLSTEKRPRSWEPDLFRMPAYLSLIVTFFIVYVFFWNMGELENPKFKVPTQMQWVGHVFNLRQHWGCCHCPTTDDGWCVMPGRLRNGKIVDVYRSGAPVTWRTSSSKSWINNMP